MPVSIKSRFQGAVSFAVSALMTVAGVNDAEFVCWQWFAAKTNSIAGTGLLPGSPTQLNGIFFASLWTRV